MWSDIQAFADVQVPFIRCRSNLYGTVLEKLAGCYQQKWLIQITLWYGIQYCIFIPKIFYLTFIN